MTIHDRINELVELHGSLRAVARVTEIDAGYLSRLRAGEKANPDKDKLRRLGLRRVVTFERLKQPNTADEPACAGRRNTMTTETIAGAGPVDQQEHFDRAFPEQPVSQPEQKTTGHDEADRIVARLLSADPDFNDCNDAAALIQREIKGPDGFATWRDAAIAERIKRVAAEQLAAQPERVALSDEQKRNLWRSATIELCSHENCYMRGIADAEREHSIKGAEQ